ncbi:MAG: hypothetical protein B6D41_11875 [Chloroflexi bacterium UTCFX4]|jgi:hypothetical protein|nr:MAG: hypothetical protein B6D41_11875 [Chloroflexi bacterium UTCFX4]
MNNKIVYSLIPIGAALVAGGIQTAIIAYAFSSEQWYIASLLIACVWITAAMDAAAFHHSAVNGATGAQKIFLALSAISLVIVLAIDLVWMFAPQAFDTSDAIIKDLSYATGINLAVSVFCLLAWIFFSQDHVDDREASRMESDARREQRMNWLQSSEAKGFFGREVRQEHIDRIAKRQRRAPFAIAEQVSASDAPRATNALGNLTPTEITLLQSVLDKTRGGNGNGNTLHADAPALPKLETRKRRGTERDDPNA